MATAEFKLPDLGEGLEDAEVVAWLVAEGDEVSLNQPLVEVDTAKALVEIPSPFSGKVTRLHAATGEVVKVGARLVTFEIEDAPDSETKRTAVLVGYGVEEGTKAKRRRRLRAAEARVPKPGTVPAESSGALAAPPVRRLAHELGVDLAGLRGTGPAGRITREDVEVAAGLSRATVPPGHKPERHGAAEPEKEPAAATEERLPVRGVRRVVAQKMARSASEIPHVTTFLTADAEALLEAKNQARALSPESKVTALAVVARAFVEICRKHPKLNASWDHERQEIVLKRYYHLGIATDTERGLVVPVVRNADSLGVPELAAEINRLVEVVRAGSASLEELTGSTVTISNVGTFGAEFGTPIINHPESSILALGLIESKPVVRNSEIVARPTVVLSLSFDHRICDGAEAGRALLDLKRLLEDPVALSSLG